MPSKEARSHFERAGDILSRAGNDKAQLRDAAAELKLATLKAQEPYAEAHGSLGLVLYELGDSRAAQQEWGKALRADPHEIRSRAGELALALEGYRESGGGLATLDVVGVVGWAVRGGLAARSRGRVRDAIDRYIQAYEHMLGGGTDLEACLAWSDHTLEIGDDLEGISLPGGCPDLFAVVARAPWGRFQDTGHDGAIRDLVRRAEGRSALHRR